MLCRRPRLKQKCFGAASLRQRHSFTIGWNLSRAANQKVARNATARKRLFYRSVSARWKLALFCDAMLSSVVKKRHSVLNISVITFMEAWQKKKKRSVRFRNHVACKVVVVYNRQQDRLNISNEPQRGSAYGFSNLLQPIAGYVFPRPYPRHTLMVWLLNVRNARLFAPRDM